MLTPLKMTLVLAAGLVLLAQASPLRANTDPIPTPTAKAGMGAYQSNPVHEVECTINNNTNATWTFAEVSLLPKMR